MDHKESWVAKNRCFWNAVLKKTVWFPWTARRSNQSILKEINPEYPSEGLLLKLQYFLPPDVKSQLIEKDPDAVKDWRHEEKRAAEDETVSITDTMDVNFRKFQEIVRDREVWCTVFHGFQRVAHDLATEQQQQQIYLLLVYWPLLALHDWAFGPWPNH